MDDVSSILDADAKVVSSVPASNRRVPPPDFIPFPPFSDKSPPNSPTPPTIATDPPLVANKSYEVRSSNLNTNGYLQVYMTDELNRSNYFPYSYFEDMAFHRDDLLSSLFGS
jgi:hypothetical protein